MKACHLLKNKNSTVTNRGIKLEGWNANQRPKAILSIVRRNA